MNAEVPQRWKHAFITPIPKKQPYSDPGNYRPISITSIFARTFEKIMKKHVLEYIEKSGVISENQFGFMKGRSVETAVLTSLNDWTAAVERGNRSDVVYFDFSKAFDKVPVDKLLIKMEMAGIHPMIRAWIQSFLTGRTYQVKVRQEYSSMYSAHSGVPQGGVLSPLLFLLYTFELPAKIARLGAACKMYADDIKIYKEIENVQDCRVIQSAIECVDEWAKIWELPLAPEKSCSFTVGTRSQVSQSAYSLRGVLLKSVSAVRDLGFSISADLRFNEHYRALVKKANFRTYNLFKILKTNDLQTLLRAYKIYVRPIVECGTTVFNPTKKKDIGLLESVQSNYTRKLFMRCCGLQYCGLPNAYTNAKKLGLPSLCPRRKKADLLV